MDRFIKTYRKIINLRPYGFWPGFIIGLAYFSYIFWWFWSLYPLDSLGIDNKSYSFLFILFAFTLSTLTTALFWGIFFFFSLKLVKKVRLIFGPLSVSSIFTLSEYLRSWAFGLVWFGNGSFLGPHWTLGNPTYLLSFLPWIVRSSSIWGIYGIDFIIMFSLSAIFLSIKSSGSNRKILFAEMLLIFLILSAINHTTTNKQQGAPLTVSTVQTKNSTKISYAPDELLNNFSQENILLKNAAKYSDIILFPETANFSQTLSSFFTSAMVQKYFDRLAPKNILVVDSNRIAESAGLKSKVIFIDSKAGAVGSYDKKLLTPGGEFIPYALRVPLSVFGYFQKNSAQDVEFTPGSGSNIVLYQGSYIKVLVCSDIISPSIGHEGVFDLMLDLGSLGIFKGNNLINSEVVTAARFRAAENGKYLVMASNYGRSYIINPEGNIIGSTNSSGYEILTGTVVPNKERTWYNKLGDLPILLMSLAIFGLSLISLKRAKQD